MHRAVDGTVICTVHDGLAGVADMLVGVAADEPAAHRLAHATFADHPAGFLVVILPDRRLVIARRDGSIFTMHPDQPHMDQLVLALHAM